MNFDKEEFVKTHRILLVVALLLFCTVAGASEIKDVQRLSQIDQPLPGGLAGLKGDAKGMTKPRFDLSSAKAVGAGLDTLDGALNRLLVLEDPFADAKSLGLRAHEGTVQVHIRTDPADFALLIMWLEGQGATDISSDLDIIQANVDLEVLRRLADHPDVKRVHRPAYAMPPLEPHPDAARINKIFAGTYTSEGVSPLNAASWHSQGHTGEGIKVGVIDSGYGTPDGAQYSQLFGTDLPPQNRVHMEAFGNFGGQDPYLSSAHGLGCAEVITDVAPGVELYLAVYGGTLVDLAQAEQWMRQNGVQVVSVSQNWMSWGPGDGSGDAADIANRFVSAGGVWVNSASNSRKAHYQGHWRDANDDGWYEFSDEGWIVDPFVYYNEQTSSWEIFCITQQFLNQNGSVPLFGALNWNQWGGSPSTNMVMCVSLVDESGYWQSDPYCQPGPGNVATVEYWNYLIESPGCYGLSVGVAGGSTSNLQFEFFHRWDGDTMNWSVGDGSVHPPATASGAIAVAAIDAETLELKSYSSAGPLNGPNGNIIGGPIKPDVSGFADVSCNAYGPRTQTGGFGGTSAACPHIAGAAALVWGANPQYSAAQVRSYLESNVVDMGSGGKDNDYGHGRVRLGSPPVGCTAPGTPRNLRASAATVSSGQSYTISWNAASSADSYQIQEATNAGFSGATLNVVSGTSRSYRHSVSINTTYYYRVRAKRTCGSTSGWSSSASVMVTGGGGSTGDYVYWVPATVHAGGQAGSQWRCDVGANNRGSSSAVLTFTLYTENGSPGGDSYPLTPGAQYVFRDIVAQLATGDQAGLLKVESEQPFMITARIFNQASNGTFGQFMDGFTMADGLSQGQTALLPQLTQNDDFRTNIGAANMGDSPATVRFTVYHLGQSIGSFDMSIPAHQWRQDTEPIQQRFSRNDIFAAHAVVKVISGSGVVAYASVVDNNTHDATTFLMKQ
ncbi:MAG: S8 family serine peptidase [Thermoanaerobaculales bacterium]|nr:S8 family serine peptidase [Thermoanaerobaculales bacterium]